MSLLIVCPPRFQRALTEIAGAAKLIDSRQDPVAELERVDGDRLVSFHSGAIIPARILNRLASAHNFHGGPPELPGRDPHHWAIYEGAATFGVTVHEMTPRVDEGPIVAVNRFDVEADATPERLRRQAEALSVWAFKQLLPEMLAGKLAPNGERWSGRKRSRADLLRLCDMTGLTTAERIRRQRAFAGFL